MNIPTSTHADILSCIASAIEANSQLVVRSVRSIDEGATQNRNFILTCATGDYFLKIYASGSMDERIFESRILKKLENAGLRFATHVSTEGPFLIGDQPAMLFDVIEGTALHPHDLSPAVIQEVATLLAKMHNLLSGYIPGIKQRFNPLGFEFTSEFELDTTDPTIAKAVALLSRSFETINPNQLHSTIIHDDLSLHNVMRATDHSLHFIDFDDAHRSYRISDIGTAIKEFVIQPSGKVDHGAIATFIHHYESVAGTAPLTSDEQLLLIPMALRRALFMYAYYTFTERQRESPLQSSEHYATVSLISA